MTEPNLPSPLVGGYRLERDQVALWFRPGEVAFPPLCACCGEPEPPRTSLKLWGEAGTLDYPLCLACQRHSTASWWILGLSLLIGLAAVGAVAAYDLELTGDVLRRKPVAYLTIGGFAVLVIAAPFWYALSALLRRKTCESDSAPLTVDIAGEIMPWNKDAPPAPKTPAQAIARELKAEAGELGYGVIVSGPRFQDALLALHGVEPDALRQPVQG